LRQAADSWCKLETSYKPPERKAAKRYMKCLADRFQLKVREGKTKRKKPPHF